MNSFPPSDPLLASALAEDLGVPVGRILDGAGSSLLERDVTSSAIVPADSEFLGTIVAREATVVCGLPAVARVFELLGSGNGNPAVECFPLVAEGADVTPGQPIMEITGPARAVLAGERTALNVLMTLSGIAGEARRWQRAAGSGMAVTDTRKTLPGLRALSKYAVTVGGAHNHRTGLFDMVLIKDNHIALSGDVSAAIDAARRMHPALLIECEADSIEQAAAAARAGADYVLLDNMDDDLLTQAVAAVREAADGRQCLTEASGRITFDRLPALVLTGVDRVSTSRLTLAAPVDFGLDVAKSGLQSALGWDA